MSSIAEAIDAASTGWARIPWANLGVAGEAELSTQGITVRCLVMPDGSLPGTDDTPGAIAVLARSY